MNIIAKNKKAFYEYFINDTIEAGIVLNGDEVKSLREGKASINESFAETENGELWLINAFATFPCNELMTLLGSLTSVRSFGLTLCVLYGRDLDSLEIPNAVTTIASSSVSSNCI